LLLKTVQLFDEKTQIDISSFAKGFYIVKIDKEAKKLIVK
jgi:thiamine biosynthesis lipoprotein ApbE